MFISMKTELKKGILDSMTTWQNLTGSPRQSFSAQEKEADSKSGKTTTLSGQRGTLPNL